MVSFANILYCATKPVEIYLTIINWPSGENFELMALKKILKATMLAAPDQSVAINNDDSGGALSLPEQAPDAVASVVRLELAHKTVEVKKTK